VGIAPRPERLQDLGWLFQAGCLHLEQESAYHPAVGDREHLADAHPATALAAARQLGCWLRAAHRPYGPISVELHVSIIAHTFDLG